VIGQVAVSQIDRGANDRTVFDPARIEQLAASMAEVGQQQPIVLRPRGDRFEIIAGERRFRAALSLGWDAVTADVRDGLQEWEAAAIMLLENVGREQLNPIDEGRAYSVRRKRFDWDAARIARSVGVKVEHVERRIALLRLAPELQALVANGNIPLGHAEVLVCLDVNRQRIAVRALNSGSGLRLADFRRMVSDLQAEQDQEGLFAIEQFYVEQAQVSVSDRRKSLAESLPVCPDLPAPEIGARSAADAAIAYIRRLESEGLSREAGAVGTLVRALIDARLIKPNGGW
jgi:ParB family chromosome partitioning protein